MSELSERLVETSRDAYRHAPASRKHESVVVAILRELSDSRSKAWESTTSWLSFLADEIEGTK